MRTPESEAKRIEKIKEWIRNETPNTRPRDTASKRKRLQNAVTPLNMSPS